MENIFMQDNILCKKPNKYSYCNKYFFVVNIFGYLLAVELDVDPMSAGVVGDEVGFELLLGDGVDVAGHPAAVHHDL